MANEEGIVYKLLRWPVVISVSFVITFELLLVSGYIHNKNTAFHLFML